MNCPACNNDTIVEMKGEKAGKLHCTHCGYEWRPDPDTIPGWKETSGWNEVPGVQIEPGIRMEPWFPQNDDQDENR